MKYTGIKISSWQLMKAGDIVTGYHKGYWKVEGIERRIFEECDLFYHNNGSLVRNPSYKGKSIGDDYDPIVYYKQVADARGNQKNGKRTYECCFSYCKPAKEYILDQIKLLEETKRKLEAFLGTL